MQDWFRQAVVYQIYPRSFYDSNGDGTGDLAGITQKLPYIASLGVNAIWLSPVYKSPMDDGGYDIADYKQIDPLFGTMQDMDALLAAAKELGLRVIMDLVLNHTSDEHPWFQKAAADPASPEAGYYIIRAGVNGGPPNNWRSYFGGPAWEQIPGTNRWYLHAFGKKQPDLNWDNPALRREMYDMVNWWLEKGVAGFRVDAVSNIKKPAGIGAHYPPDGPDGLCGLKPILHNQPGILGHLAELRDNTFAKHGCITVAEANVPPEQLGGFIGPQGVFSTTFDFSYADIDIHPDGSWLRPRHFTVRDLREAIFRWQQRVQSVGGWPAPYLENHDQPRSLSKYIPAGDRGYASASMLATLLLTLRGTPFVYQGEELGMTNIELPGIEAYDDINSIKCYNEAIGQGFTPEDALAALHRRSRDNARTPMQWSTDANAGFTKGEPWLAVNPNYTTLNAEAQQQDTTSVLAAYKAIIALRQQHAGSLIYGSFEPAEEFGGEVIAYRRRGGGSSALVLCSFSPKPLGIALPGKLLYSNLPYSPGNIAPYQAVVLQE